MGLDGEGVHRFRRRCARAGGATAPPLSSNPSTTPIRGISTCGLGHANEALTNAVAKQMGEMHHVSNLYYIPGQGDLAEWLIGKSCADKVFFCNSGAEANEGAIKLARKHAHVYVYPLLSN